MPDSALPLVTVVSVNYDGAELLPGLLDALRAQTYRDHEVVVVDNGSGDGSVDLLRRAYPEVRVLALEDNRGFVGGNNAGIRAARGEMVALANNDTVPDPRWLEELVRTLRDDPELAAVGSKILFLRPYVAVGLEVGRPEAGDGPARLLVEEETSFAGCGYHKPVFREGFAGAEVVAGRRFHPVSGRGVVYLPLAGTDGAARLDLVALAPGGPSPVRVEVGGRPVATVEVGTAAESIPVEVPAEVIRDASFDLINNAGTALSRRGDAADRGIYEPDRGQFDQEEDVEAICGAAVLLRRSALERVGLFDRDFFMYYEDTDLSWRLRKAGYRLRYQPRSVIRHVHAASSVEWSPFFVFHTARNRILMIAKNGGPRALLRAWAGELRCMIGALARALRGWAGPGTARADREWSTRLRVQASLCYRLPRALLKRAGVLAD